MKLLGRSMLHLSAALLLVLAVWAAVFFLVMRHVVRESIDEGLDDQRELILHRLEGDSTLLAVRDLGLHGFAVGEGAPGLRKSYRDTLLFVPAEGEVEPVRLMRSGFEHGGRRYSLLVYTSTVEEDDLLEHLLAALLGLYVAIVATIVVVNKLVLRRTWRPFHAILAQLKGFRLGAGRGLDDVPTRISEFRELKAAASALVRHASEAYDRQRAFTENAAHELQTPLAIAINKLELLAEEGAGEEERMAAVGEVIALLERLTRLNRSLLLLARIENRQFPDERPVSFAELARQAGDELADLAAHRGVAISVQVHGDLCLPMDPALARTLVNNLVKNAVVHNIRGGTALVEVREGAFAVSNTGADRPLDPDRIFLRFHKETTADGGTGLGLAIAKAIAGLYGLRIGYRFNGRHVITVERP